MTISNFNIGDKICLPHWSNRKRVIRIGDRMNHYNFYKVVYVSPKYASLLFTKSKSFKPIRREGNVIGTLFGTPIVLCDATQTYLLDKITHK